MKFKKIFRNFWLLAGLLFILPNLQGQEKQNSLQVSITQDLTSNLAGGIQTGQAQLGLINLDFTLSSGQMGFWNNGTFRIHIQNTYGQKPTEQLVGDVQVFSNIENGNYTYLYQFWYKHQLGNLSLLLGKHDLNEVFFCSDLAGRYINSSFGIMPVASLNVPVSIFPNTTLGFAGSYQFSSRVLLQAGLYNGTPGELSRLNFGTDLNLSASNGFFYIGEAQLKDLTDKGSGTYKIGAFHHSGHFKSPDQSGSGKRGMSGIYLIADQPVYSEPGAGQQGLSILTQIGYSPDINSLNDLYIAGGINYSGLLPGRPQDQVGLALAYASANKKLQQVPERGYTNCEAVIEATYNYCLTDKIIIQPDIQYIIHPGMAVQRKNAWAGTFRIKWSYQ